MVKISASPHFPRLLGRTPNAFQIPPRPLDWRTGTSHSYRIDSPPPLCLPVLPNEDKWVHSPPVPGVTLYLTVLWYKASPAARVIHPHQVRFQQKSGHLTRREGLDRTLHYELLITEIDVSVGGGVDQPMAALSSYSAARKSFCCPVELQRLSKKRGDGRGRTKRIHARMFFDLSREKSSLK